MVVVFVITIVLKFVPLSNDGYFTWRIQTCFRKETVFHLIMIIENERRRFVKWAVMYENGRTKVSNPIF